MKRRLLCLICAQLFACDFCGSPKLPKMRLPIKLAIGCGATLVLFVIVGFIAFPHMITGKVKSMVTLDKDSEIRQLFVKVPFGLSFRVYLFNVTNPDEVTAGKLPNIREIGPFCYAEWKEKVEVSDIDEEDAMLYKAMDTFLPLPGEGCMTGDEMITMPHPLILGMVNTIVRTKPAMLNLASKAINAIFRTPSSIFLTAKARDILFDGVIIDCNVKEFAGKAVCSQLKETPSLRHVSENELAFALMWAKNHTPGDVFKVKRGVQVSHEVGMVVEYDGDKEMDTWTTPECNQYKGTDGTIFPPFLTKEEGLASFSPDLCRSLIAHFVKDTKYDGIPVRLYSASLGDQTNNPEDKCFCPAPDNCLKKGIMDLFKCSGLPIYASLPHFYDSDESYVKGVIGLEPNEANHAIKILFESMTGSPVSAYKRLMFSMPLEPNDKVAIFNNLPTTILPLFWVEESVNLNNTFTKPLKDLFKIMKIVKVASWVVIVGCIAGLGAAAYLYFKKSGDVDITPIHKVAPNGVSNGISTVGSALGHTNKGMTVDEPDKF